MEQDVDVAIQPRARTIGLVYLGFFVAAFTAAYLANGIVVPADAAATASNLLAHESLYRAGVAVTFVSNLLYLVLVALFYRLFAPVDRGLSWLAAALGLVGCTVQIFAAIFQWAPLVMLGVGPWSTALPPGQLQALSLLSLKLYGETFNLSLVLFACYDIAIGKLIFRSNFLPRWLGAWMMIAGVGWLSFLWPPFALSVANIVMPLGALAEIALMLWLLIKGVDTAKWLALVRTRWSRNV
jgi:hypothetical protein